MQYHIWETQIKGSNGVDSEQNHYPFPGPSLVKVLKVSQIDPKNKKDEAINHFLIFFLH